MKRVESFRSHGAKKCHATHECWNSSIARKPFYTVSGAISKKTKNINFVPVYVKSKEILRLSRLQIYNNRENNLKSKISSGMISEFCRLCEEEKKKPLNSF